MFLIRVENTIVHPMDKTPKLDVLFPHPYSHIPQICPILSIITASFLLQKLSSLPYSIFTTFLLAFWLPRVPYGSSSTSCKSDMSGCKSDHVTSFLKTFQYLLITESSTLRPGDLAFSPHLDFTSGRLPHTFVLQPF